jgi:hypothetical protein
MLDSISEHGLNPLTLNRLRTRRAAAWAALAYERARRGDSAGEAAQRAVAELLAVHPGDLGEDRQAEYVDATIRVSTIRWAAVLTAPQNGRFVLSATAGAPGQTCVLLQETLGPHPGPRAQRCTYGIVWMSSARSVANSTLLVLAVQPLESWRELWVFREREDGWGVEVISPGVDEPEEGYVEYAGYAPLTHRLLIAREVKAAGRFHRRFEELRAADFALVKGANSPDSLSDFGHWQDTAWRRDTLSLH